MWIKFPVLFNALIKNRNFVAFLFYEEFSSIFLLFQV